MASNESAPRYTEQQLQTIVDQYADLLADIDRNPRFVHGPRCPEDLHDNECPLCIVTAVVGP